MNMHLLYQSLLRTETSKRAHLQLKSITNSKKLTSEIDKYQTQVVKL